MMKGPNSWLPAVWALTLLLVSNSWAFDTDTHRLLNVRAAHVSALGDRLNQQLGFKDQLAETINGAQVVDWLELGGAAEDQFRGSELLGAAFRSMNHFHNPLLPWDQAGLNATSPCPPFHLLGEASVRWAQDPSQGVSGRAAWGDARKSFHEALTFKQGSSASTKEERDRALAQTFRVLGQQMHLLGDMAVPAHTRNDPHCPLPEGFERWATVNAAAVQGLIAASPKQPDPAIFTLGVPIQDGIASVPVARLWDTDQYNGGNPAVTILPTIGIAEYTNANFFSDNTVFGAEQLPFPAKASVEPGAPETDPKTGQLRRYFKKVRDGELINHLAVPSALYEFLPDALKDKDKGLDDNVFADYAEKLLPRAVGYSAALLDYFFRGRLDVDLVADPDDSSKLKLVGTNGETSDELVEGTLALYWDDANGVRRSVPGFAPLPLAGVKPGDAISSPSFPPPAGADRFVAVYLGTLGQEHDAVIAKVSVAGGGVEELFIDAATGDLYFRNRTLLTRLNVREQVTPAGSNIGRVIWGNDGVSFMVSVLPSLFSPTNDWAIFELSGRPAKNGTWRTAPTARLVRQERFDVTWTTAVGAGVTDQVFGLALDSRREILYAGQRGRPPDPFNYKAGVLVNQSTRTTLIDYGIALLGEFGGGSVPYIVYADGAHLAESVVVVKSFAYLDRDVYGVNALTPFRTALWVGGSQRVLHTDAFGAATNHELNEQFGLSGDPVWPHSTRRHVLYSALFTDATDPFNRTTVTRVYLHDVQTGLSRVVAEDAGLYPTPHLDHVFKYDFRGSAHAGVVDRLFQASGVNVLDGTPLPESEREQFFVAWDRTTGAPLLDVVTESYPPIDMAATDLAKLVPLPPELTPRWSLWESRAIQVVE